MILEIESRIRRTDGIVLVWVQRPKNQKGHCCEFQSDFEYKIDRACQHIGWGSPTLGGQSALFSPQIKLNLETPSQINPK
jgi:hypothetical protein